MRGTFDKWLSSLTVDQRIEEADRKIQVVLDNLIAAAHLHANNEIFNYSDILRNQIPRSYAGNAYRLVSAELMRSEIIRITTAWDSPREDRNSFPTIALLVDDHSVRLELSRRAVNSRVQGRQLSAENDDPELLAWIEDMSNRRAAENAKRLEKALDEAIKLTKVTKRSPRLRSLEDFRNVFLAHSLDPRAKRYPERSARYGDETRLFARSRHVLNLFNLGVRNSSFFWSDSVAYARRNAKALWHGATISVLE